MQENVEMPAPLANSAKDTFALRRSAEPYIGFAVIWALVTVFMIVPSLKTHNWGPLGAALLGGLVFYVPIVFMGTRYRNWWKDGEIIQRAANYSMVTIRSSEITTVKPEVSDAQTLISLRRPFRRIAIYAGDGSNKRFVDVSLKHFKHEDIRKLVDYIHKRRPDLSLPKNWMPPSRGDNPSMGTAHHGRPTSHGT